MTIAYNLGIPNAPNNPSTDQPNMKTNNDNIATYVAVDHVAFNTAGSGQHNQVTFHANNVPAPPVAPPVLFTDTVQTLPQLKFFSGDAAHSSTQYVDAANGSTFLLGGIILKWGKVIAANNNSPATFAPAFPNHCYSVTVSGGAASGTQPTVNINTGSVGISGFTIKMVNGPSDVFYIAIGD